jgi:hypothetical protein
LSAAAISSQPGSCGRPAHACGSSSIAKTSKRAQRPRRRIQVPLRFSKLSLTLGKPTPQFGVLALEIASPIVRHRH